MEVKTAAERQILQPPPTPSPKSLPITWKNTAKLAATMTPTGRDSVVKMLEATLLPKAQKPVIATLKYDNAVKKNVTWTLVSMRLTVEGGMGSVAWISQAMLWPP